MLQFVWPWMLAALVAPFVVARVAPRATDATGAPVRIPYFEEVLAWSSRPAGRGPRVRQVVALLAWCALVLAAARPQWVGDPLPLPVRGRDLILALDLSGSMREQDMRGRTGFEARIDVVKRVAGDFAARRTGDRVGLIVFGSRAYLQAPLTLDLDTVSEMISETVLGLAGEQTAIGDAIGLAVKRLRERPAENRVLVLLTDGADTASQVDPVAAARFAADEGITIHTVGGRGGRGSGESLVRCVARPRPHRARRIDFADDRRHDRRPLFPRARHRGAGGESTGSSIRLNRSAATTRCSAPRGRCSTGRSGSR